MDWSSVFIHAVWTGVAIKLVATVVQLRMMEGNYRFTPSSKIFRLVYLTGKISPVLTCLCAFGAARVEHDVSQSWFTGCLTVFAAVASLLVMRARRKGTFFGLLHLFQSRKQA